MVKQIYQIPPIASVDTPVCNIGSTYWLDEHYDDSLTLKNDE